METHRTGVCLPLRDHLARRTDLTSLHRLQRVRLGSGQGLRALSRGRAYTHVQPPAGRMDGRSRDNLASGLETACRRLLPDRRPVGVGRRNAPAKTFLAGVLTTWRSFGRYSPTWANSPAPRASAKSRGFFVFALPSAPDHKSKNYRVGRSEEGTYQTVPGGTWVIADSAQRGP